MQQILEHDKCTGCGACLNVCPKMAIIMIPDKEGFEQPVIDQNKCIDCGLCQKVCPVIHAENNKLKYIEENYVQKAYAARYKDYEKRLISSSGSIFAALATCVLDNGGIVVGAAFADDFSVVQRIIKSKQELIFLQGSKYLQAHADMTFEAIKEELNKGTLVLYSGIACQVEGLRGYLRKDYNNLICLDLICMGIPSPLAWKKYLDTYFRPEGITHVNFKDKTIGWDRFCILINTSKRRFFEVGFDNKYFQCMFKHYTLRRSCFNCKFKNQYRAADITLADCWGASKLVPMINDNKGLSSVIIHTDKGLKIWDKASNLMDTQEITIKDICEGNPNMIRVVDHPHFLKRRFLFYLLNHNMINLGFALMGRSQIRTIMRRCENFIKRFVKK